MVIDTWKERWYLFVGSLMLAFIAAVIGPEAWLKVIKKSIKDYE